MKSLKISPSKAEQFDIKITKTEYLGLLKTFYQEIQ